MGPRLEDSKRVVWTTVFDGPMTKAIVLRGLLESNEVEVRILDENIKIIDPFITGANALAVQVQVPENRQDEARRLLEYRPSPSPEDLEVPSREEKDLLALGKRIRWASITMFTAPYALWLAGPYLTRVRRLGRKPPNHTWTLVGIGFSAALVFTIVSLFLER